MTDNEFTLLAQGVIEIGICKYPFALVRHPTHIKLAGGTPINGYAGVPEGHAFYGMHDRDLSTRGWEIEVHGGITFSSKGGPKDVEGYEDWWWFGFDTAHGFDDTTTQTEWYVTSEIKKLVQQLHDHREAMWLTFATKRDDGLYHLHQKNFSTVEEARNHVTVMAPCREPIIIDLSDCKRSFEPW